MNENNENKNNNFENNNLEVENNENKDNNIEIENKWQLKWKKNKVFTPKIELNKDKYFATVPYPYANAVLHIGHGRGYTTPDIFVRFQRLKGKNVLFPMAYHISGTPVLAVAEGIKRNEKKQIKLITDAISDYTKDIKEQKKLVESFKNPFNIAKYFSSTIQGSLESLGISIDWTRQFTTGDEIYKKFVTWQFEKLNEKKVLIQGKYPILYSVEYENAVGEDDIKDGDTDKVSVQEMTYILFKLENKDEFISVATLRADALFGTTNLWVDLNMDLIRVKVNNQIWITSKKTLKKLKYQFDNVELLTEFKGIELIGKFVITPLINRKVIISTANFIDENHGTGIVYSSPAGSPHDYLGLIEAKKEGRISKDLKIINTVDNFDKNGVKINYKSSCPAEDKIIKYNISNSLDEKLEIAKQELYKEEHLRGKLNSNAGEFSGMFIKDANEKIKEKLIEKNLGGNIYETTRKAVTRNGDEVIVANLEGQWFLDYRNEKIKKRAYELLDKMSFYPNKLKNTQKGYLKWVSLRPCARKRGIGTPLPFDKNWVIESLSDSTIYQMLYLVINKLNNENINIKDINSSLFDYLFLNVGNLEEISKSNNLDKLLINSMKDEFEYWKNVDFRYTANAHMSNHLAFLIYHYSLIFPEKNWPKNITIGGLLIKNGEKISKSKGNGIPIIKIKEKYGIDLYRLYIALSSNYDIEMDFKDEEIFQLEKKFTKLKELIKDSIKYKNKFYDEFNDIQKWLISRFYSKVKEYFKFMEDLRIREAYVILIYEFLNDIIYSVRRSSMTNVLEVIGFILEDYLILLTPVIPHFTEEINEKLGNKDFISLKKYSTDNFKYINKEFEQKEEIISEIISNISKQKELKNISQIKSIKIIQATNERFELFDKLNELLENNSTPKDIMKELNILFKNESNFIKKFVPKTFGNGLDKYFSKKEEFELIKNSFLFLKKEFNCNNIEIFENLQINSVNLIPKKPQILIE